MRVLIIGGTQLTGPHLVRALLRMGHQVTIYHRGNHQENVPAGVEQIIAPREEGPAEDRLHLLKLSDRLRGVRADVVVHMIAYTRADAESFLEVFAGHA